MLTNLSHITWFHNTVLSKESSVADHILFQSSHNSWNALVQKSLSDISHKEGLEASGVIVYAARGTESNGFLIAVATVLPVLITSLIPISHTISLSVLLLLLTTSFHTSTPCSIISSAHCLIVLKSSLTTSLPVSHSLYHISYND